MTTTTDRQLSVRERARIERYLLDFSYPMQDYPRKEYRQVKRELRASLVAATQDVGVDQAIKDLGSARALADGYISELGRRLPRWGTGAVVAALVIGAFMYLTLAYSLGAIDTLEALGGGQVDLSVLGVDTTAHVDEDSLWMSSRLTGLGAALWGGAALLAFALGSRFWRVLTR